MGHRILERSFLFTISSLLLIYTLFVAIVTFRGLNFTANHLNKAVLIGYGIVEMLMAPSGLWGIFGAIQNNPFQAKRYVKDHWFSLIVMTIIDGLFLGFLASYSVNRISEKPKTIQKVESEREIETVESTVLEPPNSFIRHSSQYQHMNRRKSIGYNDDNNIMIDVNNPPTMNLPQNARMLPPIVRSQSFVMPQQQKPIYHQYTSPLVNSNMYPQKLPILTQQQFRNSDLQIVTSGSSSKFNRPISLGNKRRSNSQPQFRVSSSKEILEYEKEKVSLDTKGPSNIQLSSPSSLSPPISSISPISLIADRNTIRHSKSLPMMYNKYSEINNKQIPPVPSLDNQQYKETNDISNDINSQIVTKK
ncbi:6637_t:CDS:2 [Diversispora eburnea]|uniref:6637_t:CDS:1 n=1 Tax=Diversispora eburnea TaxID=1213867 RepID=A0A9N8VLU7_9GLOM|nr:6637_t:CDS:2 [Diversispora eburnea]